MSDGSSATLPSSRSRSSRSSSIRSSITNIPFSQSQTPIICMYMHSALLADEETNYKKCVFRSNPFETALIRYINAAPGEGEIITSPRKILENIHFDDPELTPSTLFDRLYLSSENELEVNPMKYDEITNFGFEDRHHKIVNYYESPYCLKSIGYEEEKVDFNKNLSDDDGYYGIYVMNSVPKFIPKNTNLCFYKPFIDYVKKSYSEFSLEEKDEFYKIKKLKGKEYLHELNNEVLYHFLCQSTKSLFLIDWGCETDLNGNINHTFDTYIPRPTKDALQKIEDDIEALLYIIDEDANYENIDEYMNTFLRKDPINNKEFYDLYQALKLKHHDIEQRLQYHHLKDRLDTVQRQRLPLTKKKMKTISEQTRLVELNKEMKTVKRQFYKKSKHIQPSLRNLKVFQVNAKRNKGRVHKSKKGDNKYRG